MIRSVLGFYKAGINYSEELIKMYLHDDILQESVTYQKVEQLELFGESLFDFESFEDAITWLNNLN